MLESAAVRIVLDAMGGDFAPRNPVDGAVLAARTFGQPIVLVGQEEAVRAELARHDLRGLDLSVHHAPEVVAMDEPAPAETARTNPDTSIARGIALLRHGQADAFVTMGHTGATLAAASFRLGRIHGVRRPALASPFPTLAKPCALVDVGANADVRPEFLLQFAIMGSAYASAILGHPTPRVGILTIGEERGKGNELVHEALPLLEASALNFIGNIEGRDIPSGSVDVAVMDGFTGNVLVKFAEGLARLVQQVLNDAARSDPVSMLGGLLMRPALGRARHQMDYRQYGGAMLLGVRGVVVIGHGRSDAETIKNSVGVAIRGVEAGLVQTIADAVARQPVPRLAAPVAAE
jgi:glycerol-3-phosphate acyltransferase PlsX